MKVEPVLVVHGGAGRLAPEALRASRRRGYERGLARALAAGRGILLRGGSAVRAVTAAVAVLEDDELFNAGRGAALCADGRAELSAAVMNGRDLRVGAMTGLTRTRNPVLAAATLLEHAHGLLFGVEGDRYAAAAGLAQVRPSYFVTPHRVRQWKRVRASRRVALDHDGEASHGTVGAVALDRRGNLAAATSTGGLVNQLPGRVGDTPVIGAGTWANDVCAVSATGRGDAFARVAFARRLADRIELSGSDAQAAALRTLEEVSRLRATGGCIVVDASGRFAMPFSSPQMIRGWAVGRAAARVAILPGEQIEVDPRGL